MVTHTCNPSTQEGEERGLKVGGQPGQHSKTLPPKQNNETKCYTSEAPPSPTEQHIGLKVDL